MTEPTASVFISYSHKDKALVHQVAENLQGMGFHVWLDEWDVRTGDSLVERIAEAIHQVDFVVAFISQASVDSSWCQKEISLAMTGELARKGVKVLPVRIEGATVPASLKDKKYLDVSGLEASQVADKLREDLQGHLRPLRPIPMSRRSSQESRPVSDDGPIRIVGIDVAGITTPRNDGTRGSALYRVPILLSRQPDSDWAALMVRNWDSPPRFTTMHRPGIGRVSGRTFVLDGTTIGEVEEYHLDTLELAVEKTNQEYRLWQEQVRAADARREAAQAQHEAEVAASLERLSSRFNRGTKDE